MTASSRRSRTGPGRWPQDRPYQLDGLDPQADQARDRLAAHLAKTDRLAGRFEAKRMRAAEAQERAS
jgi:hypothetical protein